MAKIKQIINCECNRKFIAVTQEGGIYVPDFIFYCLSEEGKVIICHSVMNGEQPSIGMDFESIISETLLSFIDLHRVEKDEELEGNNYDGVSEEEIRLYRKEKVSKLLKVLPLLTIEDDLDEYLNT